MVIIRAREPGHYLLNIMARGYLPYLKACTHIPLIGTRTYISHRYIHVERTCAPVWSRAAAYCTRACAFAQLRNTISRFVESYLSIVRI